MEESVKVPGEKEYILVASDKVNCFRIWYTSLLIFGLLHLVQLSWIQKIVLLRKTPEYHYTINKKIVS